MHWPVFQPRRLHLQIFTDGAIRPELGASGLAAIVVDEQGRPCHFWSWQAGPLTCNEAEYAAVILALETVRHSRATEIDVYSDSQVLVRQMQGLASARAPRLRHAQVRLRGLVVQFGRVSFHHIPRQQNRLADALANEAAEGRPTRLPEDRARGSHAKR